MGLVFNCLERMIVFFLVFFRVKFGVKFFIFNSFWFLNFLFRFWIKLEKIVVFLGEDFFKDFCWNLYNLICKFIIFLEIVGGYNLLYFLKIVLIE